MFAKHRREYLDWIPEEHEPLLGRYIKLFNPVPVKIHHDSLIVTTADILLPLTQQEILNYPAWFTKKVPTGVAGWSSVLFRTNSFQVLSARLLPCCGASVCDGCHADRDEKIPGSTKDGNKCLAHSAQGPTPNKITLFAHIQIPDILCSFEITSRSFAKIFCTTNFLDDVTNLTSFGRDDRAFNHFLLLRDTMEDIVRRYEALQIPFFFEGVTWNSDNNAAWEKKNKNRLNLVSFEDESAYDLLEHYKIGSSSFECSQE